MAEEGELEDGETLRGLGEPCHGSSFQTSSQGLLNSNYLEQDPNLDFDSRIAGILGEQKVVFEGLAQQTGPHYGMYGTFLPTKPSDHASRPATGPLRDTPPPGVVGTASKSMPVMTNVIKVIPVPEELVALTNKFGTPAPLAPNAKTQALASSLLNKSSDKGVSGGPASERGISGTIMGRSVEGKEGKKSQLNRQKNKDISGGVLRADQNAKVSGNSFLDSRTPSPDKIYDFMTQDVVPAGGRVSPLSDSLLHFLELPWILSPSNGISFASAPVVHLKAPQNVQCVQEKEEKLSAEVVVPYPAGKEAEERHVQGSHSKQLNSLAMQNDVKAKEGVFGGRSSDMVDPRSEVHAAEVVTVPQREKVEPRGDAVSSRRKGDKDAAGRQQEVPGIGSDAHRKRKASDADIQHEGPRSAPGTNTSGPDSEIPKVQKKEIRVLNDYKYKAPKNHKGPASKGETVTIADSAQPPSRPGAKGVNSEVSKLENKSETSEKSLPKGKTASKSGSFSGQKTGSSGARGKGKGVPRVLESDILTGSKLSKKSAGNLPPVSGGEKKDGGKDGLPEKELQGVGMASGGSSKLMNDDAKMHIKIVVKRTEAGIRSGKDVASVASESTMAKDSKRDDLKAVGSKQEPPDSAVRIKSKKRPALALATNNEDEEQEGQKVLAPQAPAEPLPSLSHANVASARNEKQASVMPHVGVANALPESGGQPGVLAAGDELLAVSAEGDGWAQCDLCDEWRLLPPHVESKNLPDEWSCTLMQEWMPQNLATCSANRETIHAHTATIFLTQGLRPPLLSPKENGAEAEAPYDPLPSLLLSVQPAKDTVQDLVNPKKKVRKVVADDDTSSPALKKGDLSAPAGQQRTSESAKSVVKKRSIAEMSTLNADNSNALTPKPLSLGQSTLKSLTSSAAAQAAKPGVLKRKVSSNSIKDLEEDALLKAKRLKSEGTAGAASGGHVGQKAGGVSERPKLMKTAGVAKSEMLQSDAKKNSQQVGMVKANKPCHEKRRKGKQAVQVARAGETCSKESKQDRPPELHNSDAVISPSNKSAQEHAEASAPPVPEAAKGRGTDEGLGGATSSQAVSPLQKSLSLEKDTVLELPETGTKKICEQSQAESTPAPCMGLAVSKEQVLIALEGEKQDIQKHPVENPGLNEEHSAQVQHRKDMDPAAPLPAAPGAEAIRKDGRGRREEASEKGVVGSASSSFTSSSSSSTESSSSDADSSKEQASPIQSTVSSSPARTEPDATTSRLPMHVPSKGAPANAMQPAGRRSKSLSPTKRSIPRQQEEVPLSDGKRAHRGREDRGREDSWPPAYAHDDRGLERSRSSREYHPSLASERERERERERDHHGSYYRDYGSGYDRHHRSDRYHDRGRDHDERPRDARSGRYDRRSSRDEHYSQRDRPRERQWGRDREMEHDRERGRSRERERERRHSRDRDLRMDQQPASQRRSAQPDSVPRSAGSRPPSVSAKGDLHGSQGVKVQNEAGSGCAPSISLAIAKEEPLRDTEAKENQLPAATSLADPSHRQHQAVPDVPKGASNITSSSAPDTAVRASLVALPQPPVKRAQPASAGALPGGVRPTSWKEPLMAVSSSSPLKSLAPAAPAAHAAKSLLDQATDLKHEGNAIKDPIKRMDTYMRAGIKYLEALEQDEGSLAANLLQDGRISSLYDDTAKLFEFTGREYYQQKQVAAAAVAFRCAAIALTRARMCSNPLPVMLPSLQKDCQMLLHKCSMQAPPAEPASGALGQRVGASAAQPAVTPAVGAPKPGLAAGSPNNQGESPASSSASDVDDVNNQVAGVLEKRSPAGLARSMAPPTKSIPPFQAIAQSRPGPASQGSNPLTPEQEAAALSRLVRNAGEARALLDAWARAGKHTAIAFDVLSSSSSSHSLNSEAAIAAMALLGADMGMGSPAKNIERAISALVAIGRG